ncbi:MAG: 23S rRNA (adenine(2503)-C(2))-methyltransferase RlmN, partial [Spirochaetota bacterium]
MLNVETDTTTDIRDLDMDSLAKLCTEMGEPSFRGTQLAEWLWKHRVHSFDLMRNLPRAFREKLANRFSIRPAQAAHVQESADGSVKIAYRLHDGEVVEGVLIPSGDNEYTAESRESGEQGNAIAGAGKANAGARMNTAGAGKASAGTMSGRTTACISSQVGCSLRCAFCATARIPMRRNLSAAEIVDQVDDLNRRSMQRFGRPLSNIVYMGMGEPLSNYDNVVRSMRLIIDERGFGFSARRITLSTAGLVPEMHRLADENINLNLALSLHAASDPVRRNLMSSAREYSLDELANAVRYWHRIRGRKVTCEYLLLAGHNDRESDARTLVRFAGNLPCKVNIIEYNPVVGIPFSASDRATTDRFAERLTRAGITVTVRHSSGKDIDAACGQLAARRES